MMKKIKADKLSKGLRERFRIFSQEELHIVEMASSGKQRKFMLFSNGERICEVLEDQLPRGR